MPPILPSQSCLSLDISGSPSTGSPCRPALLGPPPPGPCVLLTPWGVHLSRGHRLTGFVTFCLGSRAEAAELREVEEVAQEKGRGGAGMAAFTKVESSTPQGRAADGLSGGDADAALQPLLQAPGRAGPSGSRPLTGCGEGGRCLRAAWEAPQHSGCGCASPVTAAGAAVYDATATSPGASGAPPTRCGWAWNPGQGLSAILQTHGAWGVQTSQPSSKDGKATTHTAFRPHGSLGEAVGAPTSAETMPGNAG